MSRGSEDVAGSLEELDEGQRERRGVCVKRTIRRVEVEKKQRGLFYVKGIIRVMKENGSRARVTPELLLESLGME